MLYDATRITLLIVLFIFSLSPWYVLVGWLTRVNL
jgi:hypothetical protein